MAVTYQTLVTMSAVLLKSPPNYRPLWFCKMSRGWRWQSTFKKLPTHHTKHISRQQWFYSLALFNQINDNANNRIADLPPGGRFSQIRHTERLLCVRNVCVHALLYWRALIAWASRSLHKRRETRPLCRCDVLHWSQYWLKAISIMGGAAFTKWNPPTAREVAAARLFSYCTLRNNKRISRRTDMNVHRIMSYLHRVFRCHPSTRQRKEKRGLWQAWRGLFAVGSRVRQKGRAVFLLSCACAIPAGRLRSEILFSRACNIPNLLSCTCIAESFQSWKRSTNRVLTQLRNCMRTTILGGTLDAVAKPGQKRGGQNVWF